MSQVGAAKDKALRQLAYDGQIKGRCPEWARAHHNLTARYPLKTLVKCSQGERGPREALCTAAQMQEHGRDRVRGGPWMTAEPVALWENHCCKVGFAYAEERYPGGAYDRELGTAALDFLDELGRQCGHVREWLAKNGKAYHPRENRRERGPRDDGASKRRRWND